MSPAHPQNTASSSSNFQQIFNNALEAYERCTKNDLLAHPLAAQLQACDSPSAILAVLQKQVEDLNQSRNTDHKWTKWLDPTVNVLFALSATLGEGVGLVCLRIWADLRLHPHMYFPGLLTGQSDLCRCRRSPFGTYFPLFLCIRRCNAYTL